MGFLGPRLQQKPLAPDVHRQMMLITLEIMRRERFEHPRHPAVQVLPELTNPVFDLLAVIDGKPVAQLSTVQLRRAFRATHAQRATLQPAMRVVIDVVKQVDHFASVAPDRPTRRELDGNLRHAQQLPFHFPVTEHVAQRDQRLTQVVAGLLGCRRRPEELRDLVPRMRTACLEDKINEEGEQPSLAESGEWLTVTIDMNGPQEEDIQRRHRASLRTLEDIPRYVVSVPFMN